jgi:hypothetical protein
MKWLQKSVSIPDRNAKNGCEVNLDHASNTVVDAWSRRIRTQIHTAVEQRHWSATTAGEHAFNRYLGSIPLVK